MKPGRLALWLVGLVLALGGSWLLWREAPIADPDLLFAACVALPTLWALLPVVFWRFFVKTHVQRDAPGVRAQRRAVKTLLADRGYKGSRARHSVPFYLIVGAPGAGKSSLLERSNMNLTMPVKIGGATWWVGREAVFVELAVGLPDSGLHETCEVIRGLRPLQPLNGVVLVASPADLILADRAEQRDMAEMAAQALREIEETTGRVQPTYLALAKIDLLPGFIEFFDRQEQQESEQPWGFALPFAGSGERGAVRETSDAVNRGFETLLSAMRVRLVEWLSREADPVRCARINGFGTQVAGLRSTVQPMLEALHPQSDSEWPGAMLRGIYLTSAHQEALSIDGLLPELSRRFAMPRSGMLPPDLGLDDEDQGYFVSGMLKQAIFPEAGLAGRGGSRVGRVAQWVLVSAIVLACAGAGYLVFRAFDDDVRRSVQGREMASAISSVVNPSSLDAVPSILDAMRRLEDYRGDLAGAPPEPLPLPGLTARRDLDAVSSNAIDGLGRNALAPNLAAMLETQLVDMDADIETLRQRIALASDPVAEDAGLDAWLENGASSLPESDRDYFIRQSRSLFDAGDVSIDPAYIDAARRIVAWKESLT
ncbi:type VI secretion protein IcmF/TssM N-terminal domain-containing protein [Mesorhizobium sp. CAU 1741]|uniref:type VI secretion protein IcmF/TssM N-terminal domain-containing protein n=1 Tax=Mesorhizobium sp. CAU 1741 TaxID=3140366 RepID=UPI00325B4716